ncbi:MAG: dioxygenase [Thermomicrobiales bacterium]|nr:dioxygenase [Thermomicrobiales bacterium]
MPEAFDRGITRRDLQKRALSLPAPLALLVAASHSAGIAFAEETGTPAADGAALLAPTPECRDDDDLDLTLAQTEGPYFTPDSPERTSLREDDIAGEPLTVTGFVYSSGCDPAPKALVDFWHCDADGVYDNVGYRLRGHQFTDDEGRFTLETIVPGVYPGRTRHIHVKVQAAGGPVLTTQLYFPDEPGNDRDGIFDPLLVMDIEPPTEEREETVGFFTFVVEE